MTTTIKRPTILTRQPAITPTRTDLGTLCLFRGPTPWLDPSRKLATPLWYGKRLIDTDGNEAGAAFQDAGMVQRAVESEIGLCEHQPNVQHVREGVNWIDLRDETPQERFARRVPDPMCKLFPWESFESDPFRDEPLASVTTGVKLLEASPDRLWISPSLHDEVGDYLSLADLPEAWTAGNGVTCNTWLPIRKGHSSRVGWQREVMVSFCVLAPEVAERLGNDWRAWETLRKLFESGETGAAYPTVPVVPQALDCDHEWVPITPDWPKIQGCVKCRGALKVGNSVTLNANSIAMTIAAAPAAPSAGVGNIYVAVDKQPLYQASDATTTNMYAGAASAVTQAAAVTTEATTTSTTVVDLQTATVSITTAQSFQAFANIRKSAGAAATSTTSGKVNTTRVTQNIAWASATNVAEDGLWLFIAAPRSNASYLQAYTLETGNQDSGTTSILAGNVNGPNATLTSVILSGYSGNAAITTATINLYVYSFT